MSWVNSSGIQIAPPYKESPSDGIDEIRATVLFWNDLHQIGVPLRDIASCFGVDYTVVFDYIKQIPEQAKNRHVSKEYLGRLRAAFPEGRRPKSGSDLRRVFKAAHTVDL